MNILLISPLPPPAGGIATWTRLYLNEIQAKGNYVRLVNTAVTGDRIKNFSKLSIKDEILRFKLIYKELIYELKNENFDIVHLNTSCSKLGMIRDYIFMKIIKKRGYKLFLHCHCDTEYMITNKVSEYLFKKLCKNVDLIFALNKSSREHIKKLSKKESIIIPNFLDEKEFTLEHDKLISENIENILFVGHNVRLKGCYEIIEVAKKFKNITFRMIGYVSNEIKNIPKTNNVIFTGELEKHAVIEEMRKADILFFPTHTEGFPNVVLEAMACGLPVISTKVGAIPEMIKDKGGILVNVGDKTAMCNAIENLNCKNIRLKMSSWNINQVKQNYLVGTVIDNLIEIYSRNL